MYNFFVENVLVYSVGILTGLVLAPVAKVGLKKLVELVKNA
jgi:hypothetical protein